MQDLNAYSTLQIAALRRLTSDAALAGRCDASLRERGLRGLRRLFFLLFAQLAAAGWMLVNGDFDEPVDSDVPTWRALFWFGAVMALLIAGYFGILGFLLSLVGSWRWRAGIVLGILVIAAWEIFRGQPRPNR